MVVQRAQAQATVSAVAAMCATRHREPGAQVGLRYNLAMREPRTQGRPIARTGALRADGVD
jgi:hypothetical protein